MARADAAAGASPSLHDLTRPPDFARVSRPSRKPTARKRGRADAAYALGRDSAADLDEDAGASTASEGASDSPREASGREEESEVRVGGRAASFALPAAKVLFEDWEDRIAWDGPRREPARPGRRKVPPSDSMPDWTGAILWDLPAPGAGVPAARPLLAFGSSFKLPSGSSNPFNVSNDKYYEVHEKSKNIRRLAFTHAVLQHSMPALKLQHPFYRTALTVDSLRHFHRPMLRRPAEDIVLAPLRPPKKRKGEAGFGAPKNLRDLSLRDTEPFLLLEYSEEHPPMLSNIGMGALIQNYYRRRDPRDTHVPELADGEPQVVEPETRASSLEEGSLPFFLANVEPGSTVQGFSTNMFRAPIFQHAPKSSDFLVVRHPAKEGGVNYFARPIDTVYVAGQEMPRMEVPKPSSRRVTNMLKARMMVDAYRMIKASENRGELDLSKLYKEYPEFPPLHIRQKLKELAQFQRKSSHTTMWRLAPGAQLQSEAWIQKQVSPEDVCTIQSMLSAAQRLIDGGRQISDVMGDDAGEDVDVMRDMEEDLAPWNTTKNFLMAVQGKNMIKVYGDGEPTGRGEALNMLKFPKEGTFLREEDARRGKQGEPFRSSLLEQKNAFRHEIQRVFNLQNRALNNKEELPDDAVKDEPVLSPYAESAASRRVSVHAPRVGSPVLSPPYPRAASPAPMSPPHSPGSPSVYSEAFSDEEDAQSVADSAFSQGAQAGPRNLMIFRKIRSETGAVVTEIELVDDPRVAKEYLRSRRKIDRSGMDDKQRQEATDEQLLILHKKSSRRNMVCSVCKQFGHMRSSLKCPMRQARGQMPAVQQQPPPQESKPVQKLVLKGPIMAPKRKFEEL